MFGLPVSSTIMYAIAIAILLGVGTSYWQHEHSFGKFEITQQSIDRRRAAPDNWNIGLLIAGSLCVYATLIALFAG
jgi:hypothetical protein